jgi:hypothetical protein
VDSVTAPTGPSDCATAKNPSQAATPPDRRTATPFQVPADLIRTFARELAHELDHEAERALAVDRATRALLAHPAPTLPPAYGGNVMRVAMAAGATTSTGPGAADHPIPGACPTGSIRLRTLS